MCPKEEKGVTIFSGQPGGCQERTRAVEVSVPVRTCVGCREKAPRAHLLRIVSSGSPARLQVDPSATLPGRGAWLHPSLQCVDLALRKKALRKSLRLPLSGEDSELRTQIADLLAR